MSQVPQTVEIDANTLKTAVAQVGASVLVSDRAGMIEYVNPAFLSMSGYEEAEVIGKSTKILKSGAHSRSVYEELWRTISDGLRWEGELINRHKNGSLYHVSCSIAPVFDEVGNISRFIQICVDVTEKTKLQEMLRQRDKLDSLGALSSGIAHDFRNVLAAIVNQADLARNALEKTPGENPRQEVLESLELILRTAHDAGDLVQRLLDFSAPTCSLTTGPVSLTNELETVKRILMSAIRQGIELITNWEDIDYWVKAYPFSIQQVLLNLGMNASDAIGKGEGFVRIEAKPISLSTGHPLVVEEFLTAGRYINIQVIDNGPGIPEAVREKIFEPFFSTKARRDRNGLGLAMVSRLMKELNGHISYDSALGVGTRFEVWLPLLENVDQTTLSGRALSPIKGLEPLPETKRRGVDLLFLEDDPTISKGARIILESCGFTVEHHTEGGEALKAIEGRERPFDVILCDFHLPDMDATELIGRAIKGRQNQRFVLVSGRTIDELELGSVHPYVSRIFKKPVSYFTVARELHELLEEALKADSRQL
jgi:two-component system cell cycle sensor histidine kinase/response regulator CckA